MKKLVTSVLSLFGSLLFMSVIFVLTSIALADPNSCDDSLSRHSKMDLVPLWLEFRNITNGGDVEPEYQFVTLSVENIGQRSVSRETATGEDKRMLVAIDGIERWVEFHGGVPPNVGLGFNLTLPKNTLSHCQEIRVQIDMNHTAGQWGCQVWNNDTKFLRAKRRESGYSRNCENTPVSSPMMLPTKSRNQRKKGVNR